MNKILILPFVAFAIYSCGDGAKEVSSEKEKDVEMTSHHMHESGPVLNDGKKWHVDEQMMEIIRMMESDVEHFKGEAMDDYKSLAAQLSVKIDSLTSNCTMEGEAHDELHKWLLPYIDLVNAFSKSSTQADAHSKVDELNHAFVEFNKYFE